MSAAFELIPILTARHLTIATAESCTGGLIGAALTDVPGASAAYRGGVIAYANEVKIALLGVDAEVLAQHGAVSSPVAAQMAWGARRATGADVAVSTTGIAGPGGGTPNKPVGTVWVGIATAAGEETHLLSLDPNASRDEIRRAAVERALELVRKQIEK